MKDQSSDQDIRDLYLRNAPSVGDDEIWDAVQRRLPVSAHIPKQVSAPRRKGGLRLAVFASIAVVLVAAVAIGSLEAVKHLGKDQPILYITDETTVTSSPGQTTQPAVGANGASRPITGLAMDPVDPSVLYAGSRWSLASLFVSTDAGATWELLKDFGAEGLSAGLRDPSIGPLVIDPDQPSTMYVGLGGGLTYGLLKSTDGGVTWTSLEHGGQLWLDPSAPSTLYVSFADGGNHPLLQSIDSGATWTALHLPPGAGGIWSLVIDPHDSSVLYAKMQMGGLFESTDGGVTWQDITNRLPGLVETPGWGPLSLAIDPLDGSTVCALPSEANLGYVFPPFDESTSIGLTQRANLGYTSTDQGATWSRLSDAALLELRARLKAAPGTSPASVQAAAGFLESFTRGLNVEFEPTLTESATGTVVMVKTHFVIDPDDPQRIYVGTDHGVFLSIDGGATWTMANAGLPAAE